jgi:hypothetical protein
MSDFKPSFPYNVPVHLLTVIENSIIKGVSKKKYAEPTKDNIIFCSFKTYGGTESNVNGVYSVIDTANVETWYRPDITADCRICLAENPSKMYEVIGSPENINMRNQFIKFKVQAIAGGA